MTKSKKTTKISTAESQSIKQLAKRLKVKIDNVRLVKISEITDKGFRVQVLDRDYYISFERYPYFSDATEEEIRDVALVYDTHLMWVSLDLDFTFELLDNPENSDAFGCYVRGEYRPDLFVGFKERFSQFQ